jgi:GT2 family glycosyltransferase
MFYPTVSIIVLNYNGLRYMDDCFSSLSQLDYSADCLDLVLADNASSDGSLEYVREHFPQVRILQFDRNYWFSGGMNRAVARSESELVAFLNSDMRVEPGWLKGLVTALGDEPRTVCSSSKILNWDGTLMDFGGTLFSFLGHARADGYRHRDLTAYDNVGHILAPCGGAMLIDRDVFLDVGGFDEAYDAYFEDVDLGWRLWIMGYQVVFAPQSVCYHVHFGSSSALSPAKVQYLYERNALYTILKNYEQRYLDRVLPLALFMQFKRAYLHAQMGGVDMDECRFIPTSPPASSQEVTPVSGAHSHLREAAEALRTGGPLAVARKILDKIGRRRGRPDPYLVSRGRESRERQCYQAGKAVIAAVNDVVANYDMVMEKRADVQGRRRRTDQEVFKAVDALSFGVCFDTAEYREAQRRLMEHFEIEQLFGEVFDPDTPFALGPRRSE